MLENLKRYILNRLKEPSTWYGIVQMLSAFGLLHTTAIQNEAILTMVGIIFSTGTVAIITPDRLP